MAARQSYDSCRRFGIVLCGLAALAVSACGMFERGPARAKVSGQVTLNGEPIEEGSITFIPSQGTAGPSTGSKINKGEFAIIADGGAVVGPNRVEIIAYKKTGQQIPAGTPSPAGTMVDEIVALIPPKYNRESILKFTVEPGVNENADFLLKSEATKTEK